MDAPFRIPARFVREWRETPTSSIFRACHFSIISSDNTSAFVCSHYPQYIIDRAVTRSATTLVDRVIAAVAFLVPHRQRIVPKHAAATTTLLTPQETSAPRGKHDQQACKPASEAAARTRSLAAASLAGGQPFRRLCFQARGRERGGHASAAYSTPSSSLHTPMQLRAVPSHCTAPGPTGARDCGQTTRPPLHSTRLQVNLAAAWPRGKSCGPRRCKRS